MSLYSDFISHDKQTLQIDNINSDGGAFLFTTSGIVTFNQTVIASGIDISAFKTSYDAHLYEDIISNPASGEYRITNIRLGVDKQIVITYDETSEP